MSVKQARNISKKKIRGKFDEWVYLLKNSAVRKDFSAAGIKKAAALAEQAAKIAALEAQLGKKKNGKL